MRIQFLRSNGEVAEGLESAFGRVLDVLEAFRVLELLLETTTFELPLEATARASSPEEIVHVAERAEALLATKDVGAPFRRMSEVIAGIAVDGSVDLAERLRMLGAAADVFAPAFETVARFLREETSIMDEEVADARVQGNLDWLVPFWSSKEWEDRIAEAVFSQPLHSRATQHPSRADLTLFLALLDAFRSEARSCASRGLGLEWAAV